MVAPLNSSAERKVVVDPNICIGCGVCAALCPKVYEMSNEDGKSHVVLDASTEDIMSASTKEAEAACPVAAITVTDDEDIKLAA